MKFIKFDGWDWVFDVGVVVIVGVEFGEWEKIVFILFNIFLIFLVLGGSD